MKDVSRYYRIVERRLPGRSEPGSGRRLLLVGLCAAAALPAAGFLVAHYPLEATFIGLFAASLIAMSRS